MFGRVKTSVKTEPTSPSAAAAQSYAPDLSQVHHHVDSQLYTNKAKFTRQCLVLYRQID